MDLAIPQLATVLRSLGLNRHPGQSRLKPRWPLTAVHLGPRRMVAVRLAKPPRKKGVSAKPVLEAYQERDLAPGALQAGLNPPNISDPAAMGDQVRDLLEAVAPKDIRLSVVLPDSVARVSILKFNRMPANRKEVTDLIRFRLQKVLPFRVEEASLDFQLLSGKSATEPEFLVALMQRQVLWQYERLFLGHERLPGLVDLDSFNVANLAGRNGSSAVGGSEDMALVNVADGYITVLFFRGGVLNFCRSKLLGEDEGRDPQSFSAAVRRELTSCAAYYREHLQGQGLTGTTVRAVDADLEKVSGIATEELACPTRIINPAELVSLPEGSDPSDPRWQRMAPALGAALGCLA